MDSNLTDFRVKVANTFTYGPETILSLKKTKSLMEPNGNAGLPSVGNCISGQIDLTIKRVSDVIPSMAQIDILVDASVNNIKQGTYYIDTRQNDSAEDIIYEADSTKFHCYDSMLKCEQYIYIADKDEVELWSSGKAYSVDDVVKYSNNYYICIKSHTSSSSFDSSKWELTDIGDQGTWPKTDIQVVQIIANRIGVQLESHVSTIINKAYQIEYPGYGEDAYTLKELLSYIGGMYAGNWFINDEGKLQLVQLVNSYAKTINAVNYEDCTTNEQTKPYSKVRIETGTEYYYTAGDDTGAELVVDCPWGSSQMANNILNIVRGFVYQPFDVANWIPSSNDISFELGDKVVIGDKESYIYSIDIDYDYLLTADISAPFDSEIDHEYTFKQKTLRQLTHENRDIKTSLKVQKGQIEGLIEGEIKTYRSPSDPSLTHEMHIGDLWYCLAATSDYKVNTWYRWSGSSWEETTSSIPVAEDWSSTKTYSKGNYVTGPDGKWYESKSNNNIGHEPPNTTWWKETDTISAMSQSQILQYLDSISLSVEQGENGSSIILTANGIQYKSTGEQYFDTDNAHFKGTIEASKVIALGDGFVVKDSDGNMHGFIGYGEGSDGTIQTGGVILQAAVADSSRYSTWHTNTYYEVGDKVTRNGMYFMCTHDHYSGTLFEISNWEQFDGPYVPSDENYIILTSAGARMQIGNHSLAVYSSGCYADGALIGVAVFG